MHKPLPTDNHDLIDEHARQGWAVAELLISHCSGEHDTLSNETMSCLMENIASHLQSIRDINAKMDAINGGNP